MNSANDFFEQGAVADAMQARLAQTMLTDIIPQINEKWPTVQVIMIHDSIHLTGPEDLVDEANEFLIQATRRAYGIQDIMITGKLEE